MKSKKILSIILSILILLSFTACTNHPSIYADKDDSPLTIYIPDNNEFIKYHIDKYNDAHETTQIEYDVIAKEYLNVTYNKMVKELDEGRGPDLIFVDRTFMRSTNIKQLVNGNMLTDMDELIKRSSSYDTELYNMKVIDSGIIDDTRAFIPISFTTDILASSKQLLENNGLELTNSSTTKQFIDMLNDFYDIMPDDSPAFFYYDFMHQVVMSHIDVTDNIIHPTQQFYNLIDIVNINRERYGNLSKSVTITNLKEFDVYQLVFDKNILFIQLDGGVKYTKNDSHDSDIFARLYNQYNLYKQNNNDMVIFQYPFTGGNTKTYPNMSFAVNINSDKKNKAFKFIEYMLSNDVQSHAEYAPTIPVNKSAYKLAKEKLLSGDYQLIRGDIEPNNISDDLYNQFIDIIENSDCGYNFAKYLAYKCFYQPFVNRSNGVSHSEIISGINYNLEKYNTTVDEEE